MTAIFSTDDLKGVSLIDTKDFKNIGILCLDLLYCLSVSSERRQNIMEEKTDKDRKSVSKHILPTSANLLGICFVILNFVKLWKVGRIERLIIDKVIGISIFFPSYPAYCHTRLCVPPKSQ